MKARHHLLLSDIHDTAKDDLLKIFGTIEAIKDEPEAEVIAGVNMEGPFIDQSKRRTGERRTSWLER